jgi:hypothetical protein
MRFLASEFTFATLIQRTLGSPFDVRMHYGHPDIFDRLFHVTRGGISKANKVRRRKEKRPGFLGFPFYGCSEPVLSNNVSKLALKMEAQHNKTIVLREKTGALRLGRHFRRVQFRAQRRSGDLPRIHQGRQGEGPRLRTGAKNDSKDVPTLLRTIFVPSLPGQIIVSHQKRVKNSPKKRRRFFIVFRLRAQVYLFESKISSGNGEQSLSRDFTRLTDQVRKRVFFCAIYI